MLVYPTGIPTGGSGYTIENAIWLDGSADYLTRTFGSGGNTKTWTFSTWAKPGKDWTNLTIFAQGDYNGEYTSLYFDGNAKLYLNERRSGAWNSLVKTAAVFRDSTAWVHFVLSYDVTPSTPSASSIKLFVNGAQVTAFDTTPTYAAQNADTTLNEASAFQIGRYPTNDPGYLYEGYLAETILVDGTALDADSFGESDDNGVWVPINPSVTFGNNGFHLDFAVAPGTGNGAGTDISGNGNHFTETSMTIAQQVTDTPTDSDDSGNYATLNPLDPLSHTLTEGNLKATAGATGRANYGTIAIPTTGKWYWEAKVISQSPNQGAVGIKLLSSIVSTNAEFSGSGGYGMFQANNSGLNGHYFQNNATTTPGGGASQNITWAVNDIVNIAYSADDGKIWFGKNNTYYSNFTNGTSTTVGGSSNFGSIPSGVYVPAVSGTNGGGASAYLFNFGSNAFSYTPPTGYKAIKTADLPAPTVTDPSKYFQTVIYTGDTNNNRNITGFQDAAGNNITPDWVWIKSRSHAVSHYLQDVVRGFGGSKELLTDGTQVEGSQGTGNGYIGGVVAGGFTAVDGSANDVYVNENGRTYVAWMWKAGGSASSNSDGSITTSVSAADHGGFSIATWTGNGSAGATIGHGLSRKPAMGIFKRKSLAQDWAVYHEGSDASAPEDKYLNLNLTDGVGDATWLNDTAPTTSIWTLGTSGYVNTSSETFVGYFFARTPGLIGIGTYTGNGSADGPAVICDDGASGFAPAWLMIKNINDAGTDWRVIDSVRDGGINDGASNAVLNAGRATNESDASPGTIIDKLATGFKIRGTDGNTNTSGKTHIYLAFAENPFGGDGVAQGKAR